LDGQKASGNTHRSPNYSSFATLGHWGKNRQGYRAKRKGRNDLTLDEILSRDEKSFTIFYSCIEQVRLLGPESRFALPELEIKAGKIQKMFFLTDAQFEQLSNILPNIPKLSGKLIR
jgi:hypothetical protein